MKLRNVTLVATLPLALVGCATSDGGEWPTLEHATPATLAPIDGEVPGEYDPDSVQLLGEADERRFLVAQQTDGVRCFIIEDPSPALGASCGASGATWVSLNGYRAWFSPPGSSSAEHRADDDLRAVGEYVFVRAE